MQSKNIPREDFHIAYHTGGGLQCSRFFLSASPLFVAPVEEDAADVVVADGRLLGACGHAQRTQEAVDQDGQLVDVLRLGLHHVKDDVVALAHAFGVWRADVVLND